MNKHTHTDTKDHAETIAHDTQALLAATADLANEKVVEARNRLTAAIAAARETVHEKVVAADKVIRSNPYQVMGVAFGLGFLAGLLVCRRNK